MSEFSRLYDPRFLPADPVQLEATSDERAALAARFGLVSVARLEAQVDLIPAGQVVTATGHLSADVVQPCAVSGEDLAVQIDEPVSLRFVPEGAPARPDEEIELDAEDCDEIAFAGPQFDLGEAIAQSLALAIDPYLEGPGAEAARQAAGIVPEGGNSAFAALAALKPKG